MNVLYKKLLVHIIIITNCFGMIVWYGSKSSKLATSNDVNINDRLQSIKDKGILTIASANDRPFSYIDPKTTKLAGIDSDIITDIANRLGVNSVKLKQVPFNYLLTALNNDDEIDIIASGMYVTDERKKEVLFTNEWYREPEAIITPKASKFNFKEDLKNAVMGTYSGSVFEELLNNWKKDSLVKDTKTFVNQSEVILAVASGQIDAGMLDSLSASYIVSTSPNLNLRILATYKPEIPGIVAGAVRKSDTSLSDAINKELNAMKSDGTLAAILKKYEIKQYTP